PRRTVAPAPPAVAAGLAGRERCDRVLGRRRSPRSRRPAFSPLSRVGPGGGAGLRRPRSRAFHTSGEAGSHGPRTTGRMNRSAAFPPLVGRAGCGLPPPVRPVLAGPPQPEGAIGGPMPEAWPLPIPDATVGVRHGLLPRWDAGLHVGVPLLLLGVLRAN